MSTKPGINSRFRPPQNCFACGVNKAAWTWPAVDYCYDCMPGGPFTPPPCERCGSNDYFSQGLCDRCHPGGPEHIGACRGCLAWGVTRQRSWLCSSCIWWRTHYPRGVCAYCHRESRIADQGACRLCIEQARMLQEPGRALDLAGATKHGQQLFFANMAFQRRRTPRATLTPDERPKGWKTPGGWNRPGPAPATLTVSEWFQPTLIDVDPDPELVLQRALVENSELTRYCAGIVREHAERFGWSKRQRNDVVRSLRLLQTLRDSPTAKIRASDALQLPRWGGSIVSTIDVLDAAGLLIEDRPRPIEAYFASKTRDLPAVMREQLDIWFQIMRHGSATPPRRYPRHEQTIRTQLLGIAPLLHAWAETGITSLAQITTRMINDALPDDLTQRHWADRGLRSLFLILKARKLVFADPMRQLPFVNTRTTIPFPLDPAAVRAALNHPDPATALGVALVAFHALTNAQTRALQLTDIIDGRLTLPDGRVIPLAGPVRVRLTAWLDQRAERWPRTVNPHLFVTQHTAGRLSAPGHSFPWKKAGLNPQSLRTDRILTEIHATGGDARRLCDLFGIGIESAMRYAATLGHPALRDEIPATPTRALD